MHATATLTALFMRKIATTRMDGSRKPRFKVMTSPTNHYRTRHPSVEYISEHESNMEKLMVAKTHNSQPDDPPKSERCKCCCHCIKTTKDSASSKTDRPAKKNTQDVCNTLVCFLFIIVLVIGIIIGLVVTYDVLYPKSEFTF